MKTFTRRDFLKAAMVGTAGLSAMMLAGCGSNENAPATNAPATNAPAETTTTVVGSGDNVELSAGETGVATSLTMQIPQDPASYDPLRAGAVSGSEMNNLMIETLFIRYGGREDLHPRIASACERVSEGVYLISIKDGIHDHKGYPVTVDDVIFCFEQGVACGKKGADFSMLEKIEKIDDHTLQMTLMQDLIGIFEIIMGMQIFSRKAFEESEDQFATDPVYTGPYKIKDWVSGNSITFEADENYWMKDEEELQNVMTVTAKVISESSQVAIGLETGELDFAYNVGLDDAARFEENPDFNVLSLPNNQISCLIFNNDPISPFNDVKMRQAVCYAINEEAILQSVYRGKGGIVNAWALPGEGKAMYTDYVDAWDNDERPYAYDPEKAKQLMAEAGVASGLKVRIMTKDNATDRSVAEVMQNFLGQVGIEVEIMSYENALFQTYRYDPTQWELYICGGGATQPFIPTGWKWYLLNGANGKNNVFFEDEHLQELLRTCLNTETHNSETIAACWDYMRETVPIYATVYTNKNYVCAKGINPFLIGTGYTFVPGKSTYTSEYKNL